MGHNKRASRGDLPLVEVGGEAAPRAKEVTVAARGVLFVHSCPPALRPHLEWAVAGVLGIPVRLDWDVQPLAPDCLRTQTGWRGPAGGAGRVPGGMRGRPLFRGWGTEGAEG